MNNFLSLLKVQVKEIFDFSSSKQKKQNSLSYVIFLIFGAVLFFFAFSTDAIANYFIYSTTDNPFQYGDFIISSIAMTSVMLLVFSILQVKSFVYSNKDYDFLASLPLKDTTIIYSKLAVIYIYNLTFTILTLVMGFILYGIINPIFFIFILPLFIFIPIVPILIASLLALLITYVEKKIPFSNTVKSIFLFALIIILFAFIFMTSFQSGIDAAEGEIDSAGGNTFVVEEMLTQKNLYMMIYPLLYIIQFGFFDLNPLFIILYIALNIGLGFVIVLLISKTYHYFHARHKEHVIKKKKEEKITSSSQLTTFIKKDYKAMTSSALILLNSLVGSFVTLFLIVFFSIQVPSMAESETELNEIQNVFGIVYPILICYLSTIAPMTSFSISLEGKNFWILKAFPIDIKAFIKSKLIVAHSVIGSSTLIASIIAIIFSKHNDVFLILLTLIVPQFTVLFAESLGLFMNIYFPRLDWTNERVAMKNSGSVGFTILFTTIASIFLGVIMVLSYVMINSLVSFILSLIFMIILCSIILGLLFTKGIKRFSKIEC